MNDTDHPLSVQYRDASNLDARARLHREYGRGDWFPWLAARIEWPCGARVLEVGCGAGWFWEAASDRFPAHLAVTLSDLSPGMLAGASARVRALDRRWSLTELIADANHLPFARESFDIVLACHMLYHLANPAQGVAEIARVLAPGGVALVSTNGGAALKEVFAIQAEAWPDAASDPVHRAFGLENGEAILRAAFGAVERQRYDDDLRVTRAADVEAYLTSRPPGSNADAAARARLRRAVEAAFDRGAGVLTVTKDVGVFIGRKTP